MTQTIKMLHFADIHIGMENYGRLDPQLGVSTRVRDFLDRLDEVIDAALGWPVDLVLFAGDAFKTRDPDPTQQREFAARIKRLAAHAPTFMLVGNHDIPGMSARATSLDIYATLGVDNVVVGTRPGSQVIETANGPVFLAWMPYPMRNRLLVKDDHRAKSIADLDITLRDTVVSVLNDLAAEAETHEMPRVLAGHFSVAEAELGSERSVMLGRDVAVGLGDLAQPAWDYVAMGHIHKHQDVNKGRYPAVVYSGSLERIDFGEERQPKGYCRVELARGTTQWSFEEVAARAFQTIQIDVRDTTDPTARLVERIGRFDVTDKVIKLVVSMEGGQAALVREREVAAALSKAYSFTIQKEMQHATRARLGGESVEALTPVELLEKYLIDKGYDAAQITALLERAETIFRP